MKAMGMMGCEEVMEKLWAFVDGELDAADETAVQRHLEVCNLCFPQYDFHRAYFRFVGHVKEGQQAPPDLRRRLFERILEEEASDNRPVGEDQRGGGDEAPDR
jgi:anti-sigma factor (TIGR02949 family)